MFGIHFWIYGLNWGLLDLTSYQVIIPKSVISFAVVVLVAVELMGYHKDMIDSLKRSLAIDFFLIFIFCIYRTEVLPILCPQLMTLKGLTTLMVSERLSKAFLYSII